MIKRKVRIFTRDNLFQEFLDRMDEDTTIAHYSVSNDGVHYIITERDMWKEEHAKARQKYIDKYVELQIVDRIVLQYEQRINELEEQLNELHRKRH